MFRLPYTDTQPREFVSLKCKNEEDAITEHEFLIIQPEPDGDNPVDPLEILKLAKRLMICTSCGSMKLIN